MDKHIAKISIELQNDNSEVILSGSYTNVISAICAGIKGLVVNMSMHPKYKEIKEKSKLSEEEFENEITYSVLLNILDRLDEHYVMSISNTNKDNSCVPIDMDTTEKENSDTDNDIISDTFNAFEEFVAEMDKDGNINEEEK